MPVLLVYRPAVGLVSILELRSDLLIGSENVPLARIDVPLRLFILWQYEQDTVS